jgi:hypothetical protein
MMGRKLIKVDGYKRNDGDYGRKKGDGSEGRKKIPSPAPQIIIEAGSNGGHHTEIENQRHWGIRKQTDL